MRRDNDRQGLLPEERGVREGEEGVWEEALAALPRPQGMLDSPARGRLVLVGVDRRRRAGQDQALGGGSEAREEEDEQSNEQRSIQCSTVTSYVCPILS
jgi:hypothetical protein